MSRLLKILAYLGLAAMIFLGVYYVAVGVTSLLGIAFLSSATRWVEYVSAGLVLLALAGFLIWLLMGFPRTQWYRRRQARHALEREQAAREKETALCAHLRQMGLDVAIIVFKKEKPYIYKGGERVVGSVSVANRHLSIVELSESLETEGYEHSVPEIKYRCNYVVQAKVDGLEDRLKAELKIVRKSFGSSEVVDFEWKGMELAQVLNSDANLKNMLYPPDKLALSKKGLIQLPGVEIKPYQKHRCVRISQKYFHSSPVSAFPTIETFEAYDRIAQHVRRVANLSP